MNAVNNSSTSESLNFTLPIVNPPLAFSSDLSASAIKGAVLNLL
nr:MAG TPA: hypothetical protein [Caudoviricetes sp.]